MLNLFRRGICGNVIVLGNFSQQEIANTATDDKSFISGFLELSHDLGGNRAQLFDGNPVFRSRDGDQFSNC